MIRFICLLLSIVITVNAHAQEDKHLDELKSLIGFTVSILKPIEDSLRLYSDSINTYKGGILPDFLSDECFDQRRGLWPGIHPSVSLRWEILKDVNNKKALKLILKTNDKKLKQKCTSEKEPFPLSDIPMSEYSLYSLIKKRYKELR
jgi:hypothetical protein